MKTPPIFPRGIPGASAHSAPATPDLDGDGGAGLLLGWWRREQDRTGVIPRRTALDATDFLPLLGAINLIDIGSDGRLRIRLYGERSQTADAKGQLARYIDELTPQGHRDQLLADFAEMIAAAEPFGHRVTLTGVAGEQATYLRQMLPLADDAGVFRHILVFLPGSLEPQTHAAVSRLLERWSRTEAAQIGSSAEGRSG